MATLVDLSEHDVGRHPGLDWSAFIAGFDGAIVRVANENGIADRHAQLLVDSARASGKPWGIYAWPVVGWGAERNRGFARGLVQRWQPGALGLAADAEHSPRGFATADEVLAFCGGAREAGAATLYYCAIGELYRGPLFDALPWWMADYDVNNGQYHDPNRIAPRPPADRPWAVHQFTSLGWPGGGSLDVNYAPNLDWAGVVPAPPEQEYLDMDGFLADVGNGDARFVLKSGPQVIVDVTGPSDPTFGVPAAQLSFLGVNLDGVKIVPVPPGHCDDARTIHVNALQADRPESPGEVPLDLSAVPDFSWVAETNRRLEDGLIAFTGGHVTDI